MCCLRARKDGRRTCHLCIYTAAQRTERNRQRKRTEKQIIMAARTKEAAGDLAMTRFAYVEASVQFEQALQRCTSSDHEADLCTKMAFSFFYGVRPELATPWFERASALYESTHSLVYSNTLLYLARQRWLELQIPKGLEYIQRARESRLHRKPASRQERFLMASSTAQAYYLVHLGRYADAEEVFPKREPSRMKWEGALFICARVELCMQPKEMQTEHSTISTEL